MATHVPVLHAAVQATEGPIVEFGSGIGSTAMLHRIAETQKRPLLTLDNDADWLGRFEHLASPYHELRLVSDWAAELEKPLWDERWAVAFVDQSPFEARVPTLRRLLPTTDFVVLHDCDYFPHTGLVGLEESPLNGPHDRGRRDYGEIAPSWREIFPPEPWPYGRTGPPTLLASNLRDVEEVRVDFDSMLPVWWRAVRHTRGALPRPVRTRMAQLLRWGNT